MRKISVDDLEATPRLGRTLYHESGHPLLRAGEPFGREERALLRLHNIGKVYELDEPSGGAEPGPTPMEDEETPPEVLALRRSIDDLRKQRSADRRSAPSLPEERFIRRPAAEVRDENVPELAGHDRPQGVSAKARIGPPDSGLRSTDEVARALADRDDAVKTLSGFFGELATAEEKERNGLDGPVGSVARAIVEAILHDRSLQLALVHLKEGPNGLLAPHCFNVAVLSTGIALEMGYNEAQILEIAHGALLHDVGMLRIPEEVLAKPGPLDEAERQAVRSHPYHALQSLRRLSSLPRSAPVIAFQEHERPDRSGYPHGLDSSDISEFAKIVATADIYEALTARRPWRSAREPHVALREVIQMAARRRLEPRVVRAFIQTLSLYPVGQWVRLTDGREARVVAASEADCARPTVRIVPGSDDAGGSETPPPAGRVEAGDGTDPAAPQVETVELVDERDLRIESPLDRKISRADILAVF